MPVLHLFRAEEELEDALGLPGQDLRHYLQASCAAVWME